MKATAKKKAKKRVTAQSVLGAPPAHEGGGSWVEPTVVGLMAAFEAGDPVMMAFEAWREVRIVVLEISEAGARRPSPGDILRLSVRTANGGILPLSWEAARDALLLLERPAAPSGSRAGGRKGGPK